MVLVDTSVWADLFNGHPSTEASMLRQLIENETELFTTGLIVQEILQGISDKEKRAEIRSDLTEFVLIDPSLQTHVEAAEIFAGCRKKGVTIRKSIDCAIAAITLEYDLELLHKDRDFAQIAKVFPLKLLDVTE